MHNSNVFQEYHRRIVDLAKAPDADPAWRQKVEAVLRRLQTETTALARPSFWVPGRSARELRTDAARSPAGHAQDVTRYAATLLENA